MKILYGTKERLHAFGSNSVNSEPIWMKSGRSPRSSDSLTGAEYLFVFYPLNNARFHLFLVGKILRHLNTATSIGIAL